MASLRYILITVLILQVISVRAQEDKTAKPLRVGVAGLVHTHVHWILGREDTGEIEIVGIAEPNRELAERYAQQYGFSMDIVFPTVEAMLDATSPEAVTAFNTIFGHLEVVEKCAPRGIHVMVEKPLAISLDHARKMKELAEQHGIELLTNYETTWYGSSHEAYRLAVTEGALGPVRKIVVHDGHEGPMEIGVNAEFLEWLTDPEFNGAGALFDFGCYGANLTTWLMEGRRPEKVLAVTQQIKPSIYPEVDDEATIILTYPGAQSIIQASWNWPFSRKDMEVYGKTGYAIAKDGNRMEVRLNGQEQPTRHLAPDRPSPVNDPFAMLAAIVQGRLVLPPYALSSLENNMIVMEILEAARTSAETGQTVSLD